MDILRYFKVLDLDTGASYDKANQAYRDLVSVWHPDRFAKNPRLKKKAEEKLKEINEAYKNVIAFISSGKGISNPEHESKKSLVTFKNYDTDHSQNISKASTLGKTSIQFNPGTKVTSKDQTRHWVRYLARIIDYLFLGLFFKLIDASFLIPQNFIYFPIFPILLTFAWIIPEAILLSMFGTTPGKWLLKTAIKDNFQLKPKFVSALKRSLSVWCNGMGMGIPFISPVTMVLAYIKIKKGNTSWDSNGRFSVIHGEIGRQRTIITLLFSAVIIIFLILGPDIMLKAYRQCTKIMPGNPEVHCNLGDSLATRGRCNEAVKAYRKALDIDPDYAKGLYGLGVCYVQLERFNEAIDPLKRFVQINPDHAMANYHLGISYFRILQYEKAITALKDAITSYHEFAPAHYELGLCYIALERYEEALEALKQAIKINPDNARANYNLGLCHARLLNHENAIKELKNAIRLNPDYSQALHRLGLSYIELGQYNEAIEVLNREVKNKQKSAEGYYNLGICYAKLQLADEAAKKFKHAILIKPDYAEAHHILGLMYLALENKKAALKQYEILEPLNEDLAKELLYYIENLQIGGGEE